MTGQKDWGVKGLSCLLLLILGSTTTNVSAFVGVVVRGYHSSCATTMDRQTYSTITSVLNSRRCRSDGDADEGPSEIPQLMPSSTYNAKANSQTTKTAAAETSFVGRKFQIQVR